MAAIFFGNLFNHNIQRLPSWSNPWSAGGLDALSDVLSAAAVVLAVATLSGAITGLVFRWRRGGPLVRQQLFMYSLGLVPPVVTLVVIVVADGVPGWVIGVAALPMVAAILVAIVAHNLYDLRRATHRAVLGVAMSVSVVGVYAATVLTVAALVPTAGEWWPSAVAAVAAALVLSPQCGPSRPAALSSGPGWPPDSSAAPDRTPNPLGSPAGGHLTPREQQVLTLLAQGATNRQIARRLDLSLKTIENNVSRILDKMQAADRTDAALKARHLPN